ncbi:MAG: HsdR family type I site-specific deoxyribonuclease [Opitutaceae bacterium]|nr:HsdR family type I site-specific deoxyribonuclease [Opitutaceae bacterium]
MNLTESIVEDATLTWFGALGYAVGHGPQMAPGEQAQGTLTPTLSQGERESYGEVVLVGRLREALRRLNPTIPEDAREEALRKVLRVATPSLVQTNRAFHKLLRDGIPVECVRQEPSPQPSPSGRGRSEAEGEGQRRWEIVRLIDFSDVLANDWLAVNQFTVIEGALPSTSGRGAGGEGDVGRHRRRPDIIVFVNGLPLALIELKNAADENATIWSAYAQLQTYKAEIPSLLAYNAALIVSDGLQARMGSLTANQEWFKVWREIDSDSPPPSPGLRPPSPSGRGAGGERTKAKLSLELEVLVRGVFDRQRFLDLLQHFIVFEENPDTGAIHKIIAGYHQFHAVNAAIEETVRASGMTEEGSVLREEPGTYWAGKMHGGKPGDRRAGVVWHTQGSGKSFTMLFFAARVIREPAMQNPTLVVLTDRNDLDDQLFGQFQRCADILGQTPIQAADRAHLRELLNRASGGVIFTTLQKFMPSAPSPPTPLPMGEGSRRRGEGAKLGRGSEQYRGGFDFSGLKAEARELRAKQTDAESLLWELLRDRKLAGAKFRRQHQFGEYITDFFCNDAKLVVECDGAPHATPERRKIDQKRDAYLKSQGLTVLRFENKRVHADPEAVLEEIAAHLPSTSGRGAGGKGEDGKAISLRRNIIVVADEAHRSQYDLIDGLARHMRDTLPNATFIGFTGTPIEKTDANTRAVFGDYISIYDIQRAVADKATVPIYYESRIAKLRLNASELPTLDAEFEEITEGEELTKKEKLKTKWAALEALVGDPKRLALIADDLVAHFEKRTEAMDGKAMVVCMSRRICVDLYEALIKLRPDWASAKDDDAEAEKGKACVVKVIMTGSADDGPEWQPHIRNKERRRAMANRFKDSKDPFRIVIVRDMWLTGFDAPCLHTMYADKPMQGHGLMQAIARVNRVFRDKPGGLVVDYLGLADQLKHALANYTESGGKGDPTYDTKQAIAIMLEKHGIACDLLHGSDWKRAVGDGKKTLFALPALQEHVLEQDDGKTRWNQVITELSRAFALCAASDEATQIRDDVALFQAIQSALNKQSSGNLKTPDQIDAAVRQLVSKAITTDGQVIDVFTAAGLPKPDISILSDGFLAEVRGLKHKNVAAELLEKLLKDELKVRSKRNLVQSQLFSEKLKKTLNAYHNRAISTMEVIEELIRLAKELDAATKRGEDLGLTDDEVAFYDALAANESAVKAMGDDKLKVIATELITQVRKSVTIDWTLREGARAKIRVMVKRILNKYGYPPDLQEEAVKTVLMQAELLCADWAESTGGRTIQVVSMP